MSKISWLCLCGSISGLSILFHWSICLVFHQDNTVLTTIAFSKSWSQVDGLSSWLSGKNPSASAGDAGYSGSIPRPGRSPRVGNGKPLQYSCLGNPTDRGGWGATVHGIAKESDTTWRLNNNGSGIVFLISNSTCSFLIYRKAVDFYILTCSLQPLYHYLLVPGVYYCWFFQVFCIDSHVTYEQKQSYALLPNMYTFPPNFCCLSKNFLYDVEKEGWNRVLFLLNVHYHIFCIVFVIVLILVILLVEVVIDFLFVGSKITVDGDCSYEIRWLFLDREVMTNLDSVLKSRAFTLLTKVCIVKTIIFPVITNDCESWTVKKAGCQRIVDLELWYWRRRLENPLDTRRSNQSILREINPEYSLEGLMLNLKL